VERSSSHTHQAIGRRNCSGEQEFAEIRRKKREIACAKEEKKRIRGIWAYTDDRTNLDGVNTFVWSDKNISDFIDSL
jgi:hypothetical protein